MVRERLRHGVAGLPMLPLVLLPLVSLPLFAASAAAFEGGNDAVGISLLVPGLLAIPTWLFVLKGFFMVAPNEAKVLQLFGEKMVSFDQMSPFGELHVRWTGTDEGEVTVGDEFDVPATPEANESEESDDDRTDAAD